jgi:DNA-binding transcriptional LysR family regulator
VNKALNVQLSQAPVVSKRGDLVLLGGPDRNERTRELLPAFRRTYPNVVFNFDDSSGVDASLDLSGCSLVFNFENQPAPWEDYPSYDYGLILVWLNPFTTERRRCVLCAGFTSHGTAAAAEYFLKEVAPYGRNGVLEKFKPAAPDSPPARWKRSEWPCFVMAIRVRLLGPDVAAPPECLRFVALPERAIPQA